MEEGDIPGLSLSLTGEGGVVWCRAFGVRNADTKERADESTVFEAASLSKPVFTYAVLQMCGRGQLDLDTPLIKYLPGAYAGSDERLNLITTRQVLSHTTGFPNWRPAGRPLRIHFPPGERFSYSGEAFVYLQRVIEHLAGEPLESLMRRLVFEPVGMSNSSYVWQEQYETLKTFEHNSAGVVVGRNRPALANAAGSLHTTAPDYARFVAAVLNGQGLTEEIAREMWRPQVRVPEVSHHCGGPVRLSSAVSWGLGWGLQHTDAGLSLWHWGQHLNTRAFVVAYPPPGPGVVIFANSADGLSIVHEIVREVIGGEQPAIAWLKVCPSDSPSKRLLKDILARGVAAVEEYRAGREKGTPPALDSQLESIGHQLLGMRRYREAIEVFKLSERDSACPCGVYNGLGDAYRKIGWNELAVRQFKKSLQLNPQNIYAAEMLAALQRREVSIDPRMCDAYVGEYETPLGVLSITKADGKLVGELENFSREEFIPESETRFSALNAGISLLFVRDAQGRAVELVLEADGQEIKAKRIS